MEKIILEINNKLKPNRFGKAQFTDILINNDFIKEFKTLYPEYEKIDIRKEWSNLCEILTKILCNESTGFNFSLEIGDFLLGLIQKKNIIVDIVNSSIENKAIKYLNFSTNRRPGKIIWKQPYTNDINNYLKYLGFQRCRTMKSEAVNAFKKNGNIYKDVSNKNNNNVIK
jgi:hypothetical protein